MAKKKGGPTSAHLPARAGASASPQAPRAAASAPGRGINAAPPGARLVAEAADLPGFWWRLHGIWEFVCGFLSRGVFWVIGDRKSAATHADAAGGLGGASTSATSHGDATRGAGSSAASASDHLEVVASDAAPRRGSAAEPKPADPDVLGSSPASRDKANAGPAASGSKIAASGSDQSTAFHSDGAEEDADSAQFLEAPGRITIKNSLMYTPLERQQPRPPPPPPAPPLLVVNAIEVPREQEMLYREYSRRNSGCQGKSSICHMCFFVAKRSPNYTVRNCKMAGHCLEKHGEIGTPCEDRKCQVRFRKGSDREYHLHLHFCHPLAN